MGKKNFEHGVFRSFWADGSMIETEAKLNVDTGEITLMEKSDDGVEDRGCLLKEEFENEDGDCSDVCSTCHEYILHGVMVDDPRLLLV